MVKCLCRIVAVEQACLPQSDTERFEILHERQLNRCFHSRNRFCTSALGNKGNKMTEIVFIIGQVLCDYPAITFRLLLFQETHLSFFYYSNLNRCPLSSLSDEDCCCSGISLRGGGWYSCTFFNRKCCKAKNINCAFKWREQRCHLFKPMLVLICFSALVPVHVPESKQWCTLIDDALIYMHVYVRKLLQENAFM